MIVRNPKEGVYPAVGDHVHAMEVERPDRILYVSGTMGLDVGAQPGKTLAEQLDLVWSNIRTILAAADMTVANIARVTSYLRDAAYAEENAAARVRALEGRLVPTTAIAVQTLVEDWLVEVEVIAVA